MPQTAESAGSAEDEADANEVLLEELKGRNMSWKCRQLGRYLHNYGARSEQFSLHENSYRTGGKYGLWAPFEKLDFNAKKSTFMWSGSSDDLQSFCFKYLDINPVECSITMNERAKMIKTSSLIQLNFYKTTNFKSKDLIVKMVRQDKTRQLYYIFAHNTVDRPSTAGSKS